jgi:hypothetical protein
VDGCSSLSANDTVSSDIKLELGSACTGEEDVIPPPPSQLPPHVYHPRLGGTSILPKALMISFIVLLLLETLFFSSSDRYF